MAEISGKMEEFQEAHLQDSREVDITEKSKRYWKYGAWIAGGSGYISVAMFFESWPANQEAVIGLGAFAVIVTIISLLIWADARSSEVDEETLSSHDIAQLIHAYDSGGVEAWLEKYEQIESRIEENVLISPKRREDLDNLFEEVDPDSSDQWEEHLRSNLEILAEDANRSLSENFTYPEQQTDESLKPSSSPGIIAVVRSATSSENVNTKYVFWGLFILAAVIGTVIAIWKGQGWGVLVVTILFAGLRYLERIES